MQAPLGDAEANLAERQKNLAIFTRRAARERLRRRLRVGSYFAIAILLLEGLSGLSLATSPNDHNLHITSFQIRNSTAVTSNFTVEQDVWFHGSLTGGHTDGNNTNITTRSGYHLFWFFGQTNSSGNISSVQEYIPSPSSCNGHLLEYCGTTSWFNENTTFAQPGTYNVSVTIYDADTDWVITYRTIQVDAPQFTVAITKSPGKYAHEGAVVNYTAEANFTTTKYRDQKVQYAWNMGNGLVLDGANISTTFDYRGIYEISVTAVDASTGYAARAYTTLNVTDRPPIVISFNYPTAGTLDDPVSMSLVVYDSNPVAEEGLTVLWNFTNDSYVSAGNFPGNDRIDFYDYSDGHRDAGGPYDQFNVTYTWDNLGWQNVTATVADPEGLTATGTTSGIRITLPIHHLSDIPNVVLPVGQVAYLNATEALYDSQDRSVAGSALENYTWVPGATNYLGNGTTWGSLGEYSTSYPSPLHLDSCTPTCTFSPTATSVNLTIENPGSTTTVGETNVTFTNVRPIVGVDKLYSVVNISFWLPSGQTNSQFSITNETGAPIYEGSGDNVSLTGFQENILESDVVQMSTQTGSSAVFGWLNFTYSPWSAGATKVDEEVEFVGCFHCTHIATAEFDMNSAGYDEPLYLHSESFSPGTTWLNTSFTAWAKIGGWPSQECAPTAAGPSLCQFGVLLGVPPASSETVSFVTTDQHGWEGFDNLTITENTDLGGVSVSDTAPLISLNLTGTGLPNKEDIGSDLTFGLNDSYYGGWDDGVQELNWAWGDDSNTYWDTSTSAAPDEAHLYEYQGKYVLVVTSTSTLTPGGSTGVNWTYVNIIAPPPKANFTIPTLDPGSGEAITFDGTNSTDGLGPTSQLAFTWTFSSAAHGTSGLSGFASSAAKVYKVLHGSGTYTINLTVQNPEGKVGWMQLSKAFSEVTLAFQIQTTSANLVDLWSTHTLNVTSGPVRDYALLNATWQWGTPGTAEVKGFGLTAGSTYTAAKTGGSSGKYWVNVTLKTAFGQQKQLSANWTSTYQPLSMYLPEQNGIIYGASTNASLLAQSLGTLHEKTATRSYTWTYGNGSVDKVDTSSSSHDLTYYTYNHSGTIQLSVAGSGTNIPSSTASTNLTVIPDSDGDGLPNAWKSANNIALYVPMVGGTKFETHGQGWTNYISRYLNLNNLTGDGSGLTPMQEITGSVTGFPSDPLDPNQAGDGIPNGAHFFTSSFPGNETAAFNSAYGGFAWVPIPNVDYGGPAISFNQSRIVVDLNETAGVQVGLVTSDGLNVSFDMGSVTQTAPVETYYLLNASPSQGASGRFDLAVSQFDTPGTWYLWIKYTGGVTGTIPSVTLFISYYTNPAVADPTKQGLLEGNALSTPIYNCSAPKNENYSAFNSNGFTFTKVYYWPYTESYYKLSVEQGVPYNTTENSALVSGTTNSGSACETSSSYSGLTGPQATAAFEAQANYLGDASFGIGPYNAHAAGDPLLTNGMKALGETSYNWTRGQYLESEASNPFGAGQMLEIGSSYSGYPAEPASLHYSGPLNPTTLSTAGDGIADSIAADPVAPLGLNVTIYGATDNYCYLYAGEYTYVPQDILSISQSTALDPMYGIMAPAGPTIYTSANDPTNTHNIGTGCDPVFDIDQGEKGWTYTWSVAGRPTADGISYFLPLTNQTEGSTFKVDLQLWQNGAPGPQSNRSWAQISGTVRNGTVIWNNNGTGITARIKVQPLTRAPVILVNASSDVENLTGYGYRYTGEQQLYAFNLNLGSDLPSKADPWIFQPGLNVILESRAAFLNSTANSTGLSDIEALPCLGNANVTTRSGTNASETGIVMTFSGNMSASTTCQTNDTDLLQDLLPLNATGVEVPINSPHREWIVLGSTQVELMGFNNQTLLLAPFEAPAWDDNPSGPAPTTWVSILGQDTANAWNSLKGAIIAYYNFINSIPGLLAKAGEWIVGELEGAASAVASAAAAALSALDALGNLVITFGKEVLSAILNPLVSALENYIAPLYALMLVMNSSGTVSSTEAGYFWANFTDTTFIALIAAGAALMIAFAVIEGFSLGAGFVVGVVVGIVVSAALASSESRDSQAKFIGDGDTNGVATVHSINDATNATLHDTPSNTSPAVPQSTQWLIIAGLLIHLVALQPEVGLLGWALLDANAGVLESLLTVAAFALAFVGIAADLYTLAHPNHGLSTLVLVMGGLGLILGAIAAVKAAAGSDTFLLIMELVVEAMNFAALAGGLYGYFSGG